MKPYMWALLGGGGYTALLLVVAFGGGNVPSFLAVSLLIVVSIGLGVAIGQHIEFGTESNRLRSAVTKAALGTEKAKKKLRTAEDENASLVARNRMLVGLVAKDPALLAELDDFHAWRTGDFTADEDQAIANVTRERS